MADSVPTVGATIALLELLRGEFSPFEVLEDFHPAHPDSITLVLPSNRFGRESSAITIAIVESDGA